ncbi:Hypothetical protein NGAL_HAMBI2605_51440 [Neorhizobium galegae bv. orientalis]|nr:Hypothetical protein NGAL_HAMBI2605_51440 [Neorhizobium galegae bv. orientalis]
MRARRLITAIFLLTCAKLAEPEPARPLAAQGPFGTVELRWRRFRIDGMDGGMNVAKGLRGWMRFFNQMKIIPGKTPPGLPATLPTRGRETQPRCRAIHASMSAYSPVC